MSRLAWPACAGQAFEHKGRTMDLLHCISPIDGSTYVERPLAVAAEIAAALERAERARGPWKATPVAERVAIARRAIAAFAQRETPLAEELCWMMGRPIRYAPGEIRGFVERASYMTDIAESALADIRFEYYPGNHFTVVTREYRRDEEAWLKAAYLRWLAV